MTKLHIELLPFSITKTDKDGFELPGVKINTESPKGLYDRQIYEGKLLSADKAPTDDEMILPEPRLKVSVEIEALDFDTDAIKAAANPVAEAAPATPPPQDTPPPKRKPKPKDEDK